MVKREKIILAVMGAAVVIGTLYFVADYGPKAPSGTARPDFKALQDFADRTGGELMKAGLTETQAYILERASDQWAGDPFLGKVLAAAKAEAPKNADISSSFAYTGFVITGLSRLAVINGMEYQVGEVVLGSGLEVQAIDPQNVVVKPVDGSESFNIPFTGEVLR